MSARTLEILQHALGTDEYGNGGYRNHYVTDASGPDCDACAALVGEGLMSQSPLKGDLIGGGILFYVTEAGRRYVRERSPKPPKLTRSQRRYRDFLSDDSGRSFGEWLRSRRCTR